MGWFEKKEKPAITETNPVFLRDFKYLKAMSRSKKAIFIPFIS